MRVVPGVPVEGRAHASRRRQPQRRAAIALVVGVVLVVGGAVTVIAAALQTGSTADLRALDVDGTVSPAPKLPDVDQDTPTASARPSDVLPGGLVVTAALVSPTAIEVVETVHWPDGAIVRSEPFVDGRALTLLTPIAYGAVTNLRITIDLAAAGSSTSTAPPRPRQPRSCAASSTGTTGR